MKRCIWLLLILASAFFANGTHTWAFPTTGLALPSLDAQDLVEIGEEKRDRKTERFNDESRGEGRERKGIGARFWGGPYWGYGPRWGHPCQSCRDDCDGDSDSARCKRCRVRCGW